MTLAPLVPLTKLVTAFTPGSIILAVGMDGIATNPITVTDIALMVAGFSLLWFGRVMLVTRDAVTALEVRVRALEKIEDVKTAAVASAAATAIAVSAALQAQRVSDLKDAGH